MSETRCEILEADCLDWMRSQPSNSVDLVMCSPPYEAARAYGIDFKLRGQDWVDWCLPRFLECVRICNGMVVWVVEGQTRKFRYSASPILLAADLHRAGVHLRKPPIFHRVGIPGSGGPDWLRNDYEFCICGSKGGKLPWSDNTAMGHPPRWAPGGAMSHRLSDGSRVNRWGQGGDLPETKAGDALRRLTKTKARRERGNEKGAINSLPVLANPGNVIKVNVGGGQMGDKLSHENEAPFPEKLVEWFVLSFCPPDGLVYDPFAGSGTTLAVAVKHGRRAIGTDIRGSQVDLTKRRCGGVQRSFLT